MSDVSAASAALLAAMFAELSLLSPSDRYQRLVVFLEGTLTAARDFDERRLEPSRN